MNLTPLQSWLLIIGSFVVLLLLWKSLDGPVGRWLERAIDHNGSFVKWGGEPGTRPPRDHSACRDCTYFYPDADLDHEGRCEDCRDGEEDLQSMLDYAYEHDAIFVFAPCAHSTVEWVLHGDDRATASLICSDCRVALVTETFEREWLAPEIEPEDHR